MERDVETVLLDLADAFPMIAMLVERRSGGQRKLLMGRGDGTGAPQPMLLPPETAEGAPIVAPPEEAPEAESPAAGEAAPDERDAEPELPSTRAEPPGSPDLPGTAPLQLPQRKGRRRPDTTRPNDSVRVPP